MSLLDDLEAAVASAMQAVASLLKATTYRKVSVTFNTVTKQNERSVSDYATVSLVENFNSYEIDGERVLNTDNKVTIEAANLAVTPRMNDELIFDGKTHIIKDVRSDPALATYTLQVRRSS